MIIEGDSKLAIEAFKKIPLKNNWKVYSRISDAFVSFSAFVFCELSFVKHSANVEA